MANPLMRIWRSDFFIKLRSWEYWPFAVVYAGIFVYWAWLSLKARSILFFSASNPSIENGGMLGESKVKIFQLIPDQFIPKTLYYTTGTSSKHIIDDMTSAHLSFPVIAKPDIGERGWFVEKINTPEELKSYVQQVPVHFLIQEFLNMPVEMGVFYYRFPDQPKGKVTSIVVKDMLTITGDGNSSLLDLIMKNDRAKLQREDLKKRYAARLNETIKKGDDLELVSIGNHCKGTTFLNGNHYINDRLNTTFDTIAHQIEGFYFGRFDIRVASIEDLYAGNIKIMELNGAGAEPAHIYQPGFSFFSGQRVLFHHWKVLYQISKANHKKGVPYMTFREGIKEYRKIQQLDKLK